MPTDIAGRIDAALAAEALLASTTPSAAVSRETTAAPAPEAQHPAGHAPAATGPGLGARSPRRRWAKVVLITASAATVLGLGGVLAESLQSGGSNSASKASISADGVGRLQARVLALLASAPSGKSTHMNANGTDTTPMLSARPDIPACIRDGINRSGTPLATDTFTYRGTRSYLVVLPHPSNPSRVDAYVVRPPVYRGLRPDRARYC
jgi:hypothetical protein